MIVFGKPNKYNTLISVAELSSHMGDKDWLIVDCRFSLADSEKGRQEYLLGHIPGAVYCHLNEDLCSPVIQGITGRHPLPSVEIATQRLSQLGIGSDTQVVAYDDWPGAPGGIAVRLWWTLCWLGHEKAAVLDGGLQDWQRAGLPLQNGVEKQPWRQFIPHPRPELIATTSDIDQMRNNPTYRVFDSRSPDRYRGENETIDPVAGHVPGAMLAPYMENIGPDGLFLSALALRTRFETLLEAIPEQHTAFYCGSGVTSAMNILAMVHAGLSPGKLYVGSWSEWIANGTHPVARGAST